MAKRVAIMPSPVPRNASRYPGKWVAARNGKIVGVGASLEEVRAKRTVRPDDLVVLVRGRQSGLVA